MDETVISESSPKLDPYSLASAEAKEIFVLFRKACGSISITMRSGDSPDLDKVSEFLTQQGEALNRQGWAEARVFQHETGIAFNAFAGAETLNYIGKMLEKIPEIPSVEERVYGQAMLAAFFPMAIAYLKASGVPREKWWSWRDSAIQGAPSELHEAYKRSRLSRFIPLSIINRNP